MLGTVAYAPMIRQGAVTRDGRGEVVTGIGMMLLGAQLPRGVHRPERGRWTTLAPTLPAGVTIEVFYDRTELVERTIGTVATNLFEGGVLVIAVLLLTLGNLRGGLIVASAIPLSMLVAFTGMGMAGLSGNLMSLGAIDFGLIVDGSVVMIENIVRVVGDRSKRGLPVDDAVILGAAREVASPGHLRGRDHHPCVPAPPRTDGDRREDVPPDGRHGRVRAAGLARLRDGAHAGAGGRAAESDADRARDVAAAVRARGLQAGPRLRDSPSAGW
jgi:hypothetical protein